ncbi:NADH dehydrogenase [ubiquinone] 1 beta subcomplex subunit 7 [Armadillidium nasatum]|uniref:NADH dehydrogenase [ubiquinone] 1 beta subcomplex subunit 7 n=1 Tax=Armadillidium nasatum TaxID=96803 RepID=A0A5N5T4D4_9CRUS|nr:NADH dehydrogenase [ubiquinone] 1 beta subcomplex subunit 7 [Armadillidium nasatum]
MGQSESAPLPVREKDPTHDPLYGFQKGRKEREMKVTPEEMEAMKIPLKERTYCAHHYIYYNTCRNRVWPLAYRCAKEKHAYEKCLYEEENPYINIY